MLTIDSPEIWLSKFLKQRSLRSPNGNPLFSYHMTQDEYKNLGQLVKLFQPQISFSRSKHKDWSACFVIWCAEWYRRDCDSQKWEWYPLWDQIGFELDTSQRAEIIPLGLETFWNRPIRRYESNTRNFLGSIFIEGGLPFKLISSKGNNFAESIRKVLKLYYQVDLYGVTLNELIEKQTNYLPTVFSEPESIELIGSVVKNLMSCSALVNTSDTDELPSQQLDKKLPHWRDSFPIPLDDKTGKGLLDNWLVRASKANTVINSHKDKLSCEHYFDKNSGRLYTQVSLPKKLIFKPKSSSLQSSYIDLGLLEGTKRIAEFGGSIAQIDDEKLLVPPRKKSVKIPRNALYSSLFADISQSGVIIDTLEVNDSSIPLNEAPLGFIEDNEKYKVVGQGSYEVEVLSGQQELLSQLDIDGKSYNWFKISGDVRFYSVESRFRIQSNASAISSGNLYIDGDEINSKTIPSSNNTTAIKSTSCNT